MAMCEIRLLAAHTNIMFPGRALRYCPEANGLWRVRCVNAFVTFGRIVCHTVCYMTTQQNDNLFEYTHTILA